MLKDSKQITHRQKINHILNQTNGVQIRRFRSTQLRVQPFSSIDIRGRLGDQDEGQKETKNQRTFWKKPFETNYDLKQGYWSQQYRKKEKFCGDIVVRKETRTVFKQIVGKYKRHFYPINASKSENDSSNDGTRQPKKSVEFREKLRQSDFAGQLRRLTVLSRVISENNRRETRIYRQKSIQRCKTLV